MSWTTPRTWTTGELVTAAFMNAHLRDNLNAVIDGYFLPADVFVVGSGPALAAVGSAGGNTRMTAWAFDQTAVEYILGHMVIPSYLVNSVYAYIYWSPAVATGGNVVWNLYSSNVIETDQIDEAHLETDTVTEAAGATADALQISAAMTISTSFSTTGITRLCVERNGASASDTLAGDAWFHGLLIQKVP